MSKQKKYPVPKKAQENAKKVLAWKKKYPKEVKAMTPVGWIRARQLASGKPISFNIIKRIAMFDRHRKNAKCKPELKRTPWKCRGYVAWLGWGGTEMIDYAKKIWNDYKRKNK